MKVVLVGENLNSLYEFLKKYIPKVELATNPFLRIPLDGDLYIMSVEDETSFWCDKDITSYLKGQLSECKILLCGPYANHSPWQVLFESKADFVCVGDDDETTILELCKNFDNPLIYDSILGLGNKKQSFFRGKPGQAIFLSNKRQPKPFKKKNHLNNKLR